MDTPVMLPADIESHPEVFEHPEALTEQEILDGLRLWEEIDDLDDHSNGITPVNMLMTASPGYAEAFRRATIIKTCLLEAGAPEVSIEIVDGRPGSGDTWNLCRPYAHISHHIASQPTVANPTPGLSLVKRGRSDLPGPLCNGTAGVDLVYRIVCMGMANHPGTGGPWTVSGPMGTYTIPRDVARPYAWGTEYEGGYSDEVWDKVYTNRRTGKSMSFHEFMARCNAGIARGIWLINGQGRDPGEAGEYHLSSYTGEHKTWAPGRKPDRHNYTTERGQALVDRYNDGGDDDVSAKDVWEYPIKPLVKAATAIPARVMLAQSHNRANEARRHAIAANKNSAAALRQSKATRDLVKTLIEDAGLPAPLATRALAALQVDEPVVEASDVVLDEDPTDES